MIEIGCAAVDGCPCCLPSNGNSPGCPSTDLPGGRSPAIERRETRPRHWKDKIFTPVDEARRSWCATTKTPSGLAHPPGACRISKGIGRFTSSKALRPTPLPGPDSQNTGAGPGEYRHDRGRVRDSGLLRRPVASALLGVRPLLVMGKGTHQVDLRDRIRKPFP